MFYIACSIACSTACSIYNYLFVTLWFPAIAASLNYRFHAAALISRGFIIFFEITNLENRPLNCCTHEPVNSPDKCRIHDYVSLMRKYHSRNILAKSREKGF